MRRSLAFISAILVSVTALSMTGRAAAPAQAGWAEIDITPPLGIPMGGRGPTETVGKQILDPLIAQVLYLKDSKGTGFALISFDLVSLPHDLSDRIRINTVRELGVDWNLVVLNASHTHSGPQTIHTMFAGQGPLPKNEADYFDAIAENVVAATRAAAKNLKPVTVEVFEGKSRAGINRRGHDAAGNPGMRPNPNGPVVEKVWIMKLTPSNGGASGIVFSYGCHPVMVYEFANAAISPEYPEVARKTLRAALGAGTHAQFVQGLAGDVRPRAVADVEHNRFRAATPQDVTKTGEELANAVLAAIKGTAKPLDLTIAGAFERPFVPRGDPPPRSMYEDILRNAKSKSEAALGKYWLERYDGGFGFAKGDPWPVGLVRLADNQWLCYMAGEPCAEWWPKVTQWLAPRDVAVFGYCQEGLTYMPTDEMLPEGGYEVLGCQRARAFSPSPLAAGVNEAVRHSLERQLAAIEKESK